MQFCESHYCKLNCILLSCLGIWPYQNDKTFRARLVHTLICMLFLSEIGAQLMIYATSTRTMEILMEVLIIICLSLFYIIHYSVFLWNIDKIRELLQAVEYNWTVLTRKEERIIFIEHLKKSKTFTILLIFCFGLTLGAFLLFPYSSDILNVIAPRNETRPRKYFLLKEYFMDNDEYFYPLLLHAGFVGLFGALTIVAIETLFMLFVQVVCSLFKITCYRIQWAMDESVKDLPFSRRHIVIYQRLVNAIRMHKTALQLCDVLKSPMLPVYMTHVPCVVFSLSMNLFRLSRLISNSEEIEAFTFYALLIVAHLISLYYSNYLGQEIINHSSEIFVQTYDSMWYMTSTSLRKVLLILMQKSLRPYTFVLGGIFIPSLEGFTSLTSASVSYFTVLYSTQDMGI